MSKRNGLLVITELFMPTKGGTAIWFDQVYPRVGDKAVHILTADVPGGREYDQNHANSIHRVSLARHALLRPESLFIYLKLLLKSLYILIRYAPKQVHAGRVLPEGFIAYLIALLARIPLVVYAHGEEITTWRTPKKFALMRFVYQHADRVIANSEFTRDELLKLGVSPGQIELIHPGVNLERFHSELPYQDLKQQIGCKDDELLLLSVGRLSRRKGFDQVIRSIPELNKRGLKVRYALIGIGTDQVYLSELAEQQGVCEQVHLLGHVPMDDLPRWYGACDLFVMPNREVNGDVEGFGLVYIEAAACGKTAISGQSGGAVSAVLHNQTGLNADGGDLKALTDSLYQLLTDTELRHKLATQAKKRVHTEFSWDAVAQRTCRLVDDLSTARHPIHID